MSLAAAAESVSTTPLWAVFAVASLPALVAVVAAVVASRSAKHARVAEGEAERVRLLEKRVADRKYEVYKPIVTLLGDMLDPQKSGKMDQAKTLAALRDFTRWVGVFGSDEAARAFRNFMQGTYNAAPAPILMRLYADFQLAARRDMGDASTTIQGHELLAIRVNDLYADNDSALLDAVTQPFTEAAPRPTGASPGRRRATPDRHPRRDSPRPERVPNGGG